MIRTTTPARRARLGDLIDADMLADMLGLTSHRSVSALRSQGTPLPAPVAHIGRSPIWHRDDVTRWAEATGRRLDSDEKRKVNDG